jgi:uncharacterized protein (DUF4415 family)
MSDTEPTPIPTEPPPAALTQEQVDRVVGRTRTETRQATERDILAKLGYESLEEAEKAKADHEARLQAEKSDLERAQEEAAQARAEAAAASQQAARAQLQVRIDRALLESGVSTNTLNHVSKMIEVAPDATEDDISAAVASLKEDVPQLFASPETGAPRTPSGVPKGGTGGKNKKPASKSGLAHGEDVYESMFGSSD